MTERSSSVASEWLTAKQIADKYGFSPSTIRRWSQRGLVPCVRTPTGAIRYEAAAFDAWFRSTTTGQRAALEQGQEQQAAAWRSSNTAE